MVMTTIRITFDGLSANHQTSRRFSGTHQQLVQQGVAFACMLAARWGISPILITITVEEDTCRG